LPAQTHQRPRGPASETLTPLEKVSYGFGNAASCLYWQTISAYLTFFYTDIFGISAAAAGAMIGLSRSTDAFFDPPMGMLADRTRSRWGRFRPYLLWFCVPLAVWGVLTFTVPGLGPSGKLVWAWVTYNGFMLTYTVINIPYIALLGVTTPNPHERTVLASIQFVGAFLGGLVVSATLLPMAKVGGWLGASTVQRGWTGAFVVYGVVAVACFLITFANTRERVEPPGSERTSVGQDLRDLLTNGPWLIVLAATVTFVMFGAMRSNVTAYYFKYFVGPQTLHLPAFLPRAIAGTQTWSWEGLVSVVNSSNQIASLLGAILIPSVALRLGRKRAAVALFIVAILCSASIVYLKPGQIGLNLALNTVGALASGPLGALLWTMYADTADYAEWKKGRRATGLIFSASIFSQKQGGAIGAWLTLALLQGSGFVANSSQSAGSLRGLVWLMSVLPALVGTLALGCVLFYPLSESRMAQIASDLKARRSAGPLPGAAPA
jgi:GPH family glycoside/pentoside/hexuronide:cation symporter